jgi:hypothetical protein
MGRFNPKTGAQEKAAEAFKKWRQLLEKVTGRRRRGFD